MLRLSRVFPSLLFQQCPEDPLSGGLPICTGAEYLRRIYATGLRLVFAGLIWFYTPLCVSAWVRVGVAQRFQVRTAWSPSPQVVEGWCGKARGVREEKSWR